MVLCDPFAVLTEFDRLIGQHFWPGFKPFQVPLALYNGALTLLVRHPSPPPEFAELPAYQDIRVFPGRHPAVHANTTIELGGVITATLIAGEECSATELAALLLHEAFHAFQQEHHPDWVPNEAELFSYPLEDLELLKLRRLETEALRRALVTNELGWCRKFLELRNRRFAGLPGDSVGYERALELFEGLAHYIEARAMGTAREDLLPANGFAPEEIRYRCYRVGAAIGLLLDQLLFDWKERLETGQVEALDKLLKLALEERSISPVHLSPSEEKTISACAAANLKGWLTKRVELEQEFLARPGWRVLLVAKGEPLWPQGFDPLNIRRLSKAKLLHTRWLKLGNTKGTVEVFGEALTEGAGNHPLFEGVRRVLITGLASEPQLVKRGGHVRIEVEGLRLELEEAHVEFQRDVDPGSIIVAL